ncbi:RsmB/NOP family class I SAM-dependent RNA methyltransferase [Acidianus sp. HS-5]|uniref:RsmB/NOP family class I SAM-dependent RNA methyltransferase n=1 Tax=Acidianus sp. HS-5 TaxID=2886040 RepID=UPI001F24411B|nr:RsmB/NOP family class I SAM-dependent RNA methyltransferase [Acidianus sp. HS-5]BDC19042.1 rRNA cytosine-C5-methyltransferase [Acidianus sp. HS-5]
MKDFLTTLLYFVEEKGYPLPVAFKKTKGIKKVKGINYDELYEISRLLLLSYNSLKGKRSKKVKQFLQGKYEILLPSWAREELSNYLNVRSFEGSLRYKTTWVRINTLKTDVDKVLKSLENQGVEFEQDKDVYYLIKVKDEKKLKSSEEYKEFKVLIQDKASVLTVEALEVEKGDKIIDLSSAPGSKASQIMQLGENNINLYVTDVNIDRLGREVSLLRRLGINMDKVHVIHQDSTMNSLLRADKVLLDAPCSSSGMVSNEPAIMVNLTKEKVIYYSKLQENMISEVLKINATYLIYSVCSIFPEEGEDHVLNLRTERPKISGERPYKSVNGVRLFPHINSTEGFFITKILL